MNSEYLIMKLEISAPGKTILHGEHAVVYQKAAVAVSLSLKTTLSLVSQDEDKVTLILKNIGLTKEWDLNVLNDFVFSYEVGDVVHADEDSIKKIKEIADLNQYSEAEKLALTSFLYLLIYISKSYNAGSFPSCCIEITSELSVGSGMGSSASLSVCLSTAMLILCGRVTPSLLPEDKHLINKWAFEAEKIFHGRPSGIDNSICTYGGALRFEKGAITEILPEMEGINIFLVDTKIPRSTKNLVEDVKKKKQLYSTVICPVIEAIHSISDESWNILKDLRGNGETNKLLESLKDLITMNHHLLNCLGVGHPKLNQIFEISQKYNCAAKITGSGGGGCAFILLPFNKEEKCTVVDPLKEELLSHGFGVWDIFLGTSGVQVKFQNH